MAEIADERTNMEKYWIVLPPKMAHELDVMAKEEMTSRSNLVRQAVRRYLRSVVEQKVVEDEQH